MKTIAPLAPTSHTSALCSARTPGGTGVAEGKSPAKAAYAMACSLLLVIAGLDRAIQYSEAARSDVGGSEYWMPRLRGARRKSLFSPMNSALIRVLVSGHQRQRRLQEN